MYDIKGILLDSGRVLNVSATGHWHITPNFFSYVDKGKFYSLSSSARKSAFNKAGEYINKQNLIMDEAEEYKHFLRYYEIFSTCLPELKLEKEAVESIAKDHVYNYSKYTFFSDVYEVIPELSKHYKLAVVSDAWPSLENVFKAAGLRDYFSSFVISSKKGVTKPNELMYKTALEELHIKSEEAIFIDDSILNCKGALKLGITSFVMCRDKRLYRYNKLFNRKYKPINNLLNLKNILIRS
ncbi:HAD-IA family hydrolase [Clostridium sp. 19966]|uniref:HAD-IA family hydrolase n=1 Tax=Clostridium sp. 19966 TaxID=2768166 RepID=UPI0028DDBDE0|nr:HAD-IA family hydrolase [Clostridium sp. 19966]MDT8719351.1 HAD-IA family hydrolase [Clostridium sp. 19966]